jgi:endonuclease YncB( thermonuclease family)
MALMTMVTKAHEKAPHCGVFWFFLLHALLLLSLPGEAEECRPCLGEVHHVTRVIDGDTIALKSGETIRLIGINTPELGHRGKPEQSGAYAAKTYLQRLLANSDWQVRVCPGSEAEDRYGRQLAHLSDQSGRSITSQLLRQGLGWAIAVPPNLSRLDCYLNAESLARDDKLGVWKRPPTNAASLRGNEKGFHYLQGRIVRIGESRSALWLNLEGDLALRVTWKDWTPFEIEDPQRLLGRQLEVKGWLYQRKGELRLQIRHPSSIRWLD